MRKSFPWFQKLRDCHDSSPVDLRNSQKSAARSKISALTRLSSEHGVKITMTSSLE